MCVCAYTYTAGVCSHYVLQPSPSLSLLLKPVVSRELLLPCSLAVCAQAPAADAAQAVRVGWVGFFAIILQKEEEEFRN